MNLYGYLQAKYGLGHPITILFVEANAFGIPYPLQKGWLEEFGGTEITPDLSRKLIKALTKLLQDEKREESARAGLEVLRNAYLEIKSIPEATSKDFLKSKSWLRVRLQALKTHGNRCQSCGAGAKDGAKLCVDHIKPRRLFPALALNLDNLQVLCSECNEGKGNWDFTDFRQT